MPFAKFYIFCSYFMTDDINQKGRGTLTFVKPIVTLISEAKVAKQQQLSALVIHSFKWSYLVLFLKDFTCHSVL